MCKTWRKFKSHRSLENEIIYGRTYAMVKRDWLSTIKAKTQTWIHFLNYPNPSLHSGVLWNEVNKLSKSRTPAFSILILSDNPISNPQEIASEVDLFWSSLTSDNAFNSLVIASKRNTNMPYSTELFQKSFEPLAATKADQTLI
uniref:Uncharacterized protein n=1 Tax=Glossina austeni TaxID=7395 RepID=A0A1A9VXV1_GLOAU